MKEDYLWNKTGADPEIERLENALAVFRYKEIAPPALPAKIIPFERKPRKRFFRLAFGFAACAALMVICLGVWFQFSSGKIDIAKDSPEIIAPQIVEKVLDETPVKKPGDFVVNKTETPKQFAERKIVKIKKTIPVKARQTKLTAQNVEAKKPEVKLTKEETYAYNQLMLALSITGSKLKLVKDKINGIEENTVVFENGR